MVMEEVENEERTVLIDVGEELGSVYFLSFLCEERPICLHHSSHNGGKEPPPHLGKEASMKGASAGRQ